MLQDIALGELLNVSVVQYDSGCVASGFGAREPWGICCIFCDVAIRSTRTVMIQFPMDRRACDEMSGSKASVDIHVQ